MKCGLIFITVLVLAIKGFPAEYTNYFCIHSFAGTNGANPCGDLIEGADGSLYGITLDGGLADTNYPEGLGTVFSLNKDGSGYTVLHYFGSGNGDGLKPSSALLEDKTNGRLLGTTMFGGASNNGTIFELNRDGSDYRVLKSFAGTSTDGGNPQGGLLKASDGWLYGTATSGGTIGGGLLFRIDEDGSNYEAITTLTDNIGDMADSPVGTLIEGTNGTLYGASLTGWNSFGDGMEINSHGAIFQINKDGSGIFVDASPFFTDSGIPPFHPNGPLADGGDGFIYGTTEYGPGLFEGCVFRFSAGIYWNFTVIHQFDTTIFQPQGGLIKGSDGYLYGTASDEYPFEITAGQEEPSGAIFKLDTGGTNLTVLKQFFSSPDGSVPRGRLLAASDNALYGAASSGGNGGHGIIFALAPQARSWFTGVVPSGGGFLSFHGVGASGTEFRLQGADNISSPVWAEVATNTAGITGELVFTNISAAGPCHFFRLTTEN